MSRCNVTPPVSAGNKPVETIDLKRSRGEIVCAECKRLKLKCDKRFPCASCGKLLRPAELSLSYQCNSPAWPRRYLPHWFILILSYRGNASQVLSIGTLGPVGRGRRIIANDASELYPAITSMSDRIRQLEVAVADAHAMESASKIKMRTEMTPHGDVPTPEQLAQSFAAFAINTPEHPRNQPTNGPEIENSGPGSSPDFAHITNLFVCADNGMKSWDVEQSLDILFEQLPTVDTAWPRVKSYMHHGIWTSTPIMHEELTELVVEIYQYSQDRLLSVVPPMMPHRLSVLFFVFAAATLTDTACPPYSSTAELYFELGRAALSLRSIFESTYIATIQALALMVEYISHGGRRYNMLGSWSLISLASTLTERVRVSWPAHLFDLTPIVSDRTSYTLFWEIYSMETLKALSVGNPTSMTPSQIDCHFPIDDEAAIGADGQKQPEFYHAKWQFVKQVTAPMLEICTKANPASYQVFLDLDRKLRRFIESTHFEKYLGDDIMSYNRAYLIPQFCSELILFIHRPAFVQVLQNHPDDPLSSAYAASFLATYRAASETIKANVRNFSTYPQHFSRWWPIWKSLGSIATKFPTSGMASSAILELFVAVDIVERWGKQAQLTQGSLVALQRLRNSAVDTYSQLPIAESPRIRSISNHPRNVSELDPDASLFRAESTTAAETNCPTDFLSLVDPAITGYHVLAAKTKHSGLALQLANKVYALEGKIAHVAAGGRVTPASLGHLDVARIQAQISKIEREVGAIRLAPALHDHTIDGAAHDTVALSRSMSQLAQETQVECGLLYEGQHKLRTTQRLLTEDATILSASVESLATMHDSLVATNTGLESQVTILEGKVASGAAKLHQLELSVLTLRESIATVATDTARRALTGTTNSTAIPVDTAPVAARSFDLGKARKRPAATEPDAPQAASKRAKGAIPAVVGEKSDYASWARMGPVANVSGTPANILKRILTVALGDTYIAPIVFVERDAHGLLIGFVKHADATYLVRRWAAENGGPFPLIKVSLTAMASGMGLSARDKEIAALSGN
ncbi:hypothetical protein B0H10DRAFT_1990878 [Mycena sp. CBHHK59/15]|nr:hypothetical protein B0H10DRAFT_1990878 [Mycena sp. CBHHK59/15]